MNLYKENGIPGSGDGQENIRLGRLDLGHLYKKNRGTSREIFE